MKSKQTPEKPEREKIIRSRTELRFADPEHHSLIAQAAARNKLSINAWLVNVTLQAARKDLGKG